MGIHTLVKIYQKARQILESELSWEKKYDLIFSEEISKQVSFDWCDPDMDYEDDVKAFMSAFEIYIEEELDIYYELHNGI
jgi:hypothetical protein